MKTSRATCLGRSWVNKDAVGVMYSGQTSSIDRSHTQPVVGANLQTQSLVCCPRGGATVHGLPPRPATEQHTLMGSLIKTPPSHQQLSTRWRHIVKHTLMGSLIKTPPVASTVVSINRCNPRTTYTDGSSHQDSPRRINSCLHQPM